MGLIGRSIKEVTATIAADASLSSAVNLGNDAPGHVRMPDAWTAAPLTFQVSYDGSSFSNLMNDDGTEFTRPTSGNAVAGATYKLPLADFYTAKYMKVRSGTAASPTAQAASRAVKLWKGQV